MAKPGATGVTRIINATGYSMKGLKSAWINEAAFRQELDGAKGRRIRVRVGPFASRAEADKAAARVKALGLPAAILTL